MIVLAAALLLLPQAAEPDPAMLLPAIVDLADTEMWSYEGPPIAVAVTLEKFLVLLERETGRQLDAAAIHAAFAGTDRAATNRDSATDCSRVRSRYCIYQIPESMFVDVEDLVRTSSGFRATVRALAGHYDPDGAPLGGPFEENRFVYELAWHKNRWALTDRSVLRRS